MRKRRCEILSPLTHNDDRPVSPDKFQQTKDELIAQFGAVSISSFAVIGAWVHEGTSRWRSSDGGSRIQGVSGIYSLDDVQRQLAKIQHKPRAVSALSDELVYEALQEV